MTLPKIKSFLPPTLLDLPSGRFAVFGSNWIRVPNSITFEDVRAAWIPDRPKKAIFKPGSWQIKSSKGNASYTVDFKGGVWSCTCSGFGFRRKCRHIDQVKSRGTGAKG